MKSLKQIAAVGAACALLFAFSSFTSSGGTRATTGETAQDLEVFLPTEPSYFLLIDECFLKLEPAPGGQLLISGLAKAQAEMGRVGYRHIELQKKQEGGRWSAVAQIKDDTAPFEAEHSIRITTAAQGSGTYRVRAVPFASDPYVGNLVDDHRVMYSNEWVVT